jgi:deoxyribonuclease V
MTGADPIDPIGPAGAAVPPAVAVADAEAAQRELAGRVRIPSGSVPVPRTVAGLDVSYATGSDRVVAAAVVADVATGRIIEEVTAEGVASFPYVPGLLAFREAPILLAVLERLHTPVGLLLCDGQGIAHPRRCGVACHLGVSTGIPAIGCAKNHLTGEHREPGPRRGDRAPLVENGDVLGHALRTQDGVRPVYVSPGHRIGVDQAADLVMLLCRTARLPDPLRRADHISRQALR